jgi:glutamine synthetase
MDATATRVREDGATLDAERSTSVIKSAMADGIRFAQLEYIDILGTVRSVVVPIRELGAALEHGRWFDASSVGYTNIAESDQVLMPDMDTFAVVPWKPGTGTQGTARVLCNIHTQKGDPAPGDPRGILARQVERARKLGYVVHMGPELEFYLFRRDAEGRIVPKPTDAAGYMAFSTYLAQDDLRDQMVNALEAFGIRVEAAHHEVAAGQHEIDFRYSDALRTADNATTFKYTVKAIAQQHGMYATFMPKPMTGKQGTGMHTHQSLYSIAEGRNAFADPTAPYGLSRVARSYMAGVLQHARAMLAVLAPTVNSYKRLVPGYEVPVYVAWGRTNRSALVRVPMVSPGMSLEGTRFEIRCPDASSNAYLAFAVMIAAGLDGIENDLPLPDAVDGSLFEMDEAELVRRGVRKLPRNLGESLDELEADPVICAALGPEALAQFVATKRAEWNAFQTEVTQWEIDRYLETF